jgi:hypothetical protein
LEELIGYGNGSDLIVQGIHMSPSHWLVSDILKLIGYTLRSNIEAVTDGVASRGAPDLLALNVSSPT